GVRRARQRAVGCSARHDGTARHGRVPAQGPPRASRVQLHAAGGQGRIMPNLNDPHFDEPREHEGFRALRARVARQAGSERLGLSLWEVPPGEAAYPYHFHYTEEELVIVL